MHPKNESAILYRGRKITFPLDLTDRHTYRRTDIIVHRVASLKIKTDQCKKNSKTPQKKRIYYLYNTSFIKPFHNSTENKKSRNTKYTLN